MGTTAHLGLTTPTVNGSDDTWGDTLNTVIDDLDNLIGGVGALTGTTPTVDLSTNDRAYTLSTTGNTTFTFSNPATNFDAFTLKIAQGGAYTLTWPASVDWADGVAPAAPDSGDTDVYVFLTYDGGTTWIGALSVDAAA